MKLTINGITLNVECPQLEVIEDKLDKIIKGGKFIMATLEEVKGQVIGLNTLLDGYRAAVALIQAELDALKSGAQLAPAVAAKIDEISALITETQNENFPPVTPPPPEV